MQDSIKNTRHIQLIGVPSGYGAKDSGCAHGPEALYHSDIQHRLQKAGFSSDWHMLRQQDASSLETTEIISHIGKKLSNDVGQSVSSGRPFIIVGGDHSCAIGSWSGVAAKCSPFGLIWVDAHLDSHTPDTSHSHAIHGMPLASLLGFGEHSLTHLPGPFPKLQPQHVCLIGVRSFESEEIELLKKLNVSISFMKEVKKRGLKKVMQEAINKVSSQTRGFGISIDLDAIDPADAPGVGSPVAGGLSAKELVAALSGLARQPGFLGMEIAELNPLNDQNNKTTELTCALIETVFKGAST